MELEEIQELLLGEYEKVIAQVKDAKPGKVISVEDALKQLDPAQHKVMDQTVRKKKTRKKKDSSGRDVEDQVEVARLPLVFQKRIVRLAATFLCANAIKLSCQAETDQQKGFLGLITKVWDDNKLDYKTMQLAKLMMGETECAELWYTQQAEEGYWNGTINEKSSITQKLRVRILANSLGDSLYPVFDATGDMVAFGRGYEIKSGDKTIKHFDLYTNDKTIKGDDSSGQWFTVAEPNPSGKIPIIYYSQPEPEWSDVQALIERLETSLSNNADTNDYFSSPIVFVEGEVIGYAEKGDSGKVLQGKQGGKASYLTWNQAPESTKLEYEMLLKFIYTLTNTPNISFDEMKSLGTFSGIALRMLFMDAHLKAAEKEGIFGESIQRRINFIKAATAKINITLAKETGLSIKPVFEYYLPKNILETIQLLSEAIGGGKALMSQKTAMELNPLVSDVEIEESRMEEEGVLGSDLLTA